MRVLRGSAPSRNRTRSAEALWLVRRRRYPRHGRLLRQCRLPRATLLAVLPGLAEVGGLAFAAGFLTPLAALGIVVVMLTAIGVVHWSKGFWNTAGGYEFNLVLLTVALAVTATGPGALLGRSRDRLGRQHQRPVVGARRRGRGRGDRVREPGRASPPRASARGPVA